jgi:hypothetical protein
MSYPVLRLLGLLAAPVFLLGAPGLQAPHAAWRTLQTTHYRIHYPPVLSDWAQEVAERVEGIHARVTALVGYASPERVQVVLVDPMGEANGRAMPLLPAPYVTLWRTEPQSDNLHGGAMTSWTDLLVTHELAHIHHLLRPSRKPGALGRLFGLPVGPLVLKAPRWVLEGYATLVEGRVTGSGRPHSAIRAAILRQWALAGKLPPYETLSSTQGYLGGNQAYMVGSAYLEWLERQVPAQPDVLQRLWKHLASRKGRGFEAAFKATFGFSALDGYQRFQAETAHDALAWEARLKAEGLRPGDLWLRTDGGITDLAVSPDGTRLLARLEHPKHGGLRVWDLAPAATKAPQAPRPPDPLNEVADAPPECLSPQLRASLPSLNGQPPQSAQWVDADTILFQLKHPDHEGTLIRHPALWQVKSGAVTEPAQAPAPRYRTLEPRHVQGQWVLAKDGQTVPLPGQPAGRAFDDEPRHQILAACEVEGIWNLVRVPYQGAGASLRFEPAQRLTRTAAAAWNPAPTPDGRWLYFTSLDARGVEIRRLDLTLPPLATNPQPEPRLLGGGAVTPPAVEANTLPEPAPPPPSQPYDALRNLYNQMGSAATLTPSGTSYQVGGSGADLLGRLSWQVLVGFGSGAGPRGATLGLSSTAWRWKPSFSAFSALERPSLQATGPVARDRERRGAELALEYEDLGAPLLWFSPVVAWEREVSLTGAAEGPALTRTLGGVRSGLQHLWSRGPWGLAVRPSLDLYAGTTTRTAAAQSWNAVRTAVVLQLGTPVTAFTLKGEQGRFGGTSGAAFTLGGVTTSLVPLSLDLNRVEQPALPAYTAVGNRFLRYRAELGTQFRAYLEGDALWNDGQGRTPFHRVAGLELALELPSPGREQVGQKLKLELGIHRPLDGIMKSRTVGTLSLVVRP